MITNCSTVLFRSPMKVKCLVQKKGPVQFVLYAVVINVNHITEIKLLCSMDRQKISVERKCHLQENFRMTFGESSIVPV